MNKEMAIVSTKQSPRWACVRKVVKVVDMANMCCGRRRCPIVTKYEDGSLLVEDDGKRIEFTPEQAHVLLDMLKG